MSKNVIRLLPGASFYANANNGDEEKKRKKNGEK